MSTRTTPSTAEEYDWTRTWEMCLDLWPSWAPTESQIALWRDKLGRRLPEDVRQAIQDVAGERATLTPRLAWVRAKLGPGTKVGERKKGGPCSRCGRAWVTDASLCDDCCAQDVREMREELAALPQEARHAAVERARPALEKVGISANVSDDVATWPAGLVGWTWAAAQVLDTRSPRGRVPIVIRSTKTTSIVETAAPESLTGSPGAAAPLRGEP